MTCARTGFEEERFGEMVLFSIDHAGKTPVYKQVIQGIIARIDDGTLAVGTRLPPTRRLCETLGINRSTAYRAYQELIALGYIESQPGSYTTVRKRVKIATGDPGDEKSLISWNKVSTSSSRRLYQKYVTHAPEYETGEPSDVVNLSRLYIEERLFPINHFRRCLNQVLSDDGSRLFGYGDIAGYAPLRETIARRMQTHGITVSADNILMTHGAQQALELIVKLLAESGKKVVVESPTYSNVIPLLEFCRASILKVPMRDDGMDLDALERILRKHQPAFIYTMPNFHNPTGITTSQAHRERLLSLCERYRTPVVEDGFEEELKYFGKSVLPIKSMDHHQTVIYVGTFSKVLFPGLRTGWIAADRECVRRLGVIKRFSDLSENMVIQAAMALFLSEGYYDLHVRRIHSAYRQKMALALTAMEKILPAGVTWTKPDGGYTIWVTAGKPYKDDRTLDELMRKHGVLVSPGRFFFCGSSPRRYFRISIANSSREEIGEGIIRFGRLLRDLTDSNRRG
jgi:DNA-binding transcriptional MocR family regulator